MKKALLILFFLLPQSSFASVIFEDDFDSYSTGYIVSQSDWIENASSDFTVSTTQAFSAPNSLTGGQNRYIYQDFSSAINIASSTFAMSVDFYNGFTTTGSTLLNYITLRNSVASSLFSVRIYENLEANTQDLKIYSGNTVLQTVAISNSEWHNVQLQVTCNGSNNPDFSLLVDGEDTYDFTYSAVSCSSFIVSRVEITGGAVSTKNSNFWDGLLVLDSSFVPVYVPDSIAVIYPTPALVTASTTVEFNIEYSNYTGYYDTLDLEIFDTLGNYVGGFTEETLTSSDNIYYSFSGVASSTYRYSAYMVDENLEENTTSFLFSSGDQQYFSLLSEDAVFSAIFASSTEPESRECSISDLSGCMYNALIWAFYPSSTTFQKYLGLKNTIMEKAPLGYFVLTRNELLGINASSTSAFSINISGGLSEYLFDPLDLGLSAILIFFFMVQIYKFLKTAQLWLPL